MSGNALTSFFGDMLSIKLESRQFNSEPQPGWTCMNHQTSPGYNCSILRQQSGFCTTSLVWALQTKQSPLCCFLEVLTFGLQSRTSVIWRNFKQRFICSIIIMHHRDTVKTHFEDWLKNIPKRSEHLLLPITYINNMAWSSNSRVGLEWPSLPYTTAGPLRVSDALPGVQGFPVHGI